MAAAADISTSLLHVHHRTSQNSSFFAVALDPGKARDKNKQDGCHGRRVLDEDEMMRCNDVK